jgi:NADH-quinone oxidoreductase subunit B
MGIDAYVGEGFFATVLSKALGWARQYSFWPMPFATACCGIEYMSAACSDYDIGRFGAERPSFSPRQADLLVVLGTISYKMAPVLKRIYEQMAEPKWVISFGVCATSGGMFEVYSTLQGIDKIIPVDLYIPGCPPRPEMYIDALVKLQKKVKDSKITDYYKQGQK